MPLTTKITEDCQGIIQTGSGLVTGDELVEACRTAFRLVQNTRNFDYEVVDLSEATDLQITPAHLDRLTDRYRLAATYRPDAIVVIVAPRDEFYELGKTWECRMRDLGWTTHVSRKRSEALQWLKENFHRPPVKGEATSANSPATGANWRHW